MGLSVQTFESLTPAEFIYAWLGWLKQQRDRVIHEWELTRWQTWVLTSIQLERKDRKPLEQMFPMPWDSAEKMPEEPLSLSERQKRVKEILQCIDL